MKNDLFTSSVAPGPAVTAPVPPVTDLVDLETQRCLDALEYIIKYKGPEKASHLIQLLLDRLRGTGAFVSTPLNTPYINKIAPESEPAYPGDREIERKLKSIIRWNAMAMVVKANRLHEGLGGHISTFASSATLYEVGFNHFFRGNGLEHRADQVFFQGHASPGNYARAFVEGRLSTEKSGLQMTAEK